MTLAARWWRLEEAAIEAGNRDAASGYFAETTARDSGVKPGKKAVRCGLCMHTCLIDEGKWGYCGARQFTGEVLVSPYLGQFSSVAVDPIEKKPLYHWRPGSSILSLGSLGCTMRCPFCQNHGIAHPPPGKFPGRLEDIPAQALVATARRMRLNAVAYTYNEPALQAEYILNAVPLLKEAGIATVLVSNGMFSHELLEAFADVVDAANIDLKTYNSRNYAKLGGNLETVRHCISRLLERGVHVEVTTLVVPGISDSPEEFAAEVEWLSSLSPDIPLHISRYRPAYKYTAPPTDIGLLQRFASIASATLRHVHLGNMPFSHTR
jgi:Pyruvate-formate lyase-activating enzyme